MGPVVDERQVGTDLDYLALGQGECVKFQTGPQQVAA